MTYNPFKDAQRRLREDTDSRGLGIGIVVDVPDDAHHQVIIKELTDTGDGADGPIASTVMVAQQGDIALPSEGDLVVFNNFKSDDAVVFGTVYSKEAPSRDYAADERHIGADEGGGTFLHGPFGVVPKVSRTPSDAVDGAVWYRTDLDEYRGRQNGNTVRFDTTIV